MIVYIAGPVASWFDACVMHESLSGEHVGGCHQIISDWYLSSPRREIEMLPGERATLASRNHDLCRRARALVLIAGIVGDPLETWVEYGLFLANNDPKNVIVFGGAFRRPPLSLWMVPPSNYTHDPREVEYLLSTMEAKL